MPKNRHNKSITSKHYKQHSLDIRSTRAQRTAHEKKETKTMRYNITAEHILAADKIDPNDPSIFYIRLSKVLENAGIEWQKLTLDDKEEIVLWLDEVVYDIIADAYAEDYYDITVRIID